MTAQSISRTYTVQEAAARTGLTEHTLRYYERAQLITPIPRDGSSNHRRYTEENLRAIQFLKRLRATGMPIWQMQQYVGLFLEGKHTMEQRRALLEAHGQSVRDHIADLQANLAVIEYKIDNYERLEAERDLNDTTCLDIAKGNSR